MSERKQGYLLGVFVAFVTMAIMILLAGCTAPRHIPRLPQADIHRVIRTSLKDYHETLTTNNRTDIENKLLQMNECFQGVIITDEISDADVGRFDKTNWRSWFMKGLYDGETLEDFNARSINGNN